MLQITGGTELRNVTFQYTIGAGGTSSGTQSNSVAPGGPGGVGGITITWS
jgi:hypothetical protein